MSQKLEAVQRQAIKIIFGWDEDYNKLVEQGIVVPLAVRREEAIDKFAIKAANSERFGPAWFQRNIQLDREVRPTTRNTYVEKHYRTERGRNNPLAVMTRRLNALNQE